MTKRREDCLGETVSVYCQAYTCVHLDTLLQHHLSMLYVCVSSADTLARPRDGPGEGGKPVVIPKENQEKMKEMFKINQFNLMASEMIAMNRSLPDVRLEG